MSQRVVMDATTGNKDYRHALRVVVIFVRRHCRQLFSSVTLALVFTPVVASLPVIFAMGKGALLDCIFLRHDLGHLRWA